MIQLESPYGCESDDGTGGSCQNGRALLGIHDVTVSPDGQTAYAAAIDSDAVVVFNRGVNPTFEPGYLAQKAGPQGCVSDDGTSGQCTDGKALDGAKSVAVSPDGLNVYAATSTGVVVFDVATTGDTGSLQQKGGTDGCVSDDGTGGECADGTALSGTFAVAVSPDGRNVYVAAFASDALAVFDRDPATGVLTQKASTAGCISENGSGGACVDGKALHLPNSVTVSPDGRNVYVTSEGSDAVAVFDRDLSTGALTQKASTAGCVSDDGTSGACTDGVALLDPRSVVVAQDGLSVYVASHGSDAVAALRRQVSDGALVLYGDTGDCVSETGTGGACADGVGLDGANDVAVSPDGRSVYVTSDDSDAVAVLDRDPSNGRLTQKGGPAACVSETGTSGTCFDGVALDSATSVAVSPDGRSVYAGAAISGAVASFTRVVPTDDIDGDGAVEALTDGLLELRYFFGFRGSVLIAGAVDLDNCTRCTAAEIEAYLEALLGP